MSIYGTPLTASKNNTYFPGENISIINNKISTKAFPCNPNLLDNWYFGNPVNQRGQTEYAPAWNGYSIDRWSVEADREIIITIVNGGIHVKSTATVTTQFKQILPSDLALAGQTITISVLCSEVIGEVSCKLAQASSSYQATVNAPLSGAGLFSASGTALTGQQKFIFDLAPGSECTIRAAKLELGSQQTLAHKENGAWVLNEVPKFGDQLAECQRYLVDITPIQKFNASYIGELSSNGATIFIPLSTSMRTYPTFIGNASDIQIAVESASVYYTPTSVSVICSGSAFVTIRCDFVHDKSPGTLCDFRKASDGAKFFLSAEL